MGAVTKLLFRAGFAPVAHLEARKRPDADCKCPYCGHPDEDVVHMLLDCHAFNRERDAMLEQLGNTVGAALLDDWWAQPPQAQVQTMLGDHFWGNKATAVDRLVQAYLLALVRARAARLQNAHNRTNTASTPAGARAHGSCCYG